MRSFRTARVLVAFTLALCGAAKAATYNFTSFDFPGNNGGGTTVNGINNHGDVVGFASDNAATPTLFTNAIRNPSGGFSVLSVGVDPLAMANGVNISGTVVGGFSNGQAFRLAGTAAALPQVNGTTTFETAFGINDTGSIVGQYTDGATGLTLGFLLRNGAFTVLVPAVNAAVVNAQSVNNNGLVAGFYSADGVHQHGFLYNPATSTFMIAPDPVVANLVLTQFLGINDSGIVSGYYQTADGSQHGLLYNINTRSYTFLDDPSAARSGVSITQITGINDAGELAGFYVDPVTGLQRGFVAAVATPEQGTLSLSGGALAAFAVLLRRTARNCARQRRHNPDPASC